MSVAVEPVRPSVRDPKAPMEKRDGRSPVDSLKTRETVDLTCRMPCLLFFATATIWLVLGTVFAMLASIKLHNPNFLADAHWLTFGRVRPAHLNAVAFGWGSNAGLGVLLWLMCRLSRVPMMKPEIPVVAAVLWNLGCATGIAHILVNGGNGIEWLEFPTHSAFMLFGAFGLVAVWAAMIFNARKTAHVYVSLWYLMGAIFMFPWLYSTAQVLMLMKPVKGIAHATIHWWFAHNALGVWFTPVGLGAIYYFLPKVIGRPIYSYYLSLLGFWSVALFYNWAGAHHVIAGPVPAWVLTLSIIGSMMMLIPVATVAINHHMTTRQGWETVKASPVLRFIVFGAFSYTLASVQGSLMALRVINEPFHFTHNTIAHAHLGLYAFFTMVMFGSLYYIMPRLTGREWASQKLIKTHFWCCAIGIATYVGFFSIGGFIQGFEMNQASEGLTQLVQKKGLFAGTSAFFSGFKNPNGAVPFMTIMENTKPWLVVRSLSGTLLTIGHLAFAALVFMNVTGVGGSRPFRPFLSENFTISTAERRSGQERRHA